MVSAVLAFFIFSGTAYATNIGTAVRGDSVKILEGGYVTFEVLLWNSRVESYDVGVFPKSVPDGWIVFAQPETANLSSESGSELIQLPYMKKPVKATPIKIFVTPTSAKPGKYKILVEARNLVGGEEVYFSQGRMFEFLVVIPGEIADENDGSVPVVATDEAEVAEPIYSAPDENDGRERTGDLNILILAIGVGILAVSVIIYRYA